MNKKVFKSYPAVMDYMYSQLPMFQRIGAPAYKKDLSNTIHLCKVLDNPEKKLRCIHVAGTNGKGTVSHIIAAGLQAQGYKVGIYTSPHYKDFRERIKINGEFIPQSYIINFTNTLYQHLQDIKLSFFEMTVCLAFKYFADCKVDFAVIETGLGGRLDSTNVITPLLSVITNISKDHQNLLGNTLEEIAGEKAGIIKYKIPVIIGERQSTVERVFLKKAAECEAPIFFADDQTMLKKKSDTFSALNEYDVFIHQKLWIKSLKTDLTGPFQEKNLMTGFYVLSKLSEIIPLNVNKIKSFFPQLKTETYYIGRWQILQNQPLVIADSAHNEAGISIVMTQVSNLKYKKLHIVMGFVNDKQIDEIINLFPKDALYYFAKANIPRGLPADELQSLAYRNGLIGKSYSSVKRAYAAAKRKANIEDCIFIGGSIFVVAEVL